jgi:hypothetical protein
LTLEIKRDSVLPLATEPLVDDSSPPVSVSGLSDVRLSVWRLSDGYYLNWNSNTFEASVINNDRLLTLTERDGATDPGVYEVVSGIDTGSWTNALDSDFYRLRVDQAGGDADNIPMTGEFRTDGIVVTELAVYDALTQSGVQDAMTSQGYTTARAPNLDNLDTAISTLNNLSSADIQAALTAQGYTGDLATRILLSHKILRNRLSWAGDGTAMYIHDDDDSVLLTFTAADKEGNSFILPDNVPTRRGRGT